MPIFLGSFGDEVAHLSTLQVGIYVLLVDAWWQRGQPLAFSDRQFAMVTKLICVRKWRRVRPRIEHMFDITAAGWTPKPMQWMRGFRGDRRLLPRPANEMPANWPAIRREVFARDNHTCRYCQARGGELECDHVVPRSRGGADHPDNLVTACKPCNRVKRARTPEEMGWSLH